MSRGVASWDQFFCRQRHLQDAGGQLVGRCAVGQLPVKLAFGELMAASNTACLVSPWGLVESRYCAAMSWGPSSLHGLVCLDFHFLISSGWLAAA